MILLFLLSVIQNYYAIDVGTEYLKIASANYAGDPVMVNTPGFGVKVPNSIAFKSSKPISEPITSSSANDIEFKFGQQAKNILIRNSSLGYQFLPRSYAHYNSSEFSTTSLLHPFPSYALTIRNLLTNLDHNGLYLAIVPHHWTLEQRHTTANGIHINGVRVKSIIDDTTAMAVHYGATKHSRFASNYTNATHMYNVLFVDIGGTSVKIFGISYYMGKQMIISEENTVQWNETIGGYWFRKKMSTELNISMKKAEKMLQRGNQTLVLKIIENEVNLLYRLLMYSVARSNIISPVEEIQLIGGASAYPFIYDIVLQATNVSKIKREFNRDEALALGGVYYILQSEEASKFLPCINYKRPSANATLKCQNEAQICIRGINCIGEVIEHSTGCTEATITADSISVSPGVSPKISKIKLNNITNMNFTSNDSGYGIFNISYNAPSVEAITWCKNSTHNSAQNTTNECYPIDFSLEINNDEEIVNQSNETFNLIMSLNSQSMKEGIIVKLGDVISRLAGFFERVENKKVEAAVHVTEEHKEKFVVLSKKFYSESFKRENLEYVNEVYNDVLELASMLRIKVNVGDEL